MNCMHEDMKGKKFSCRILITKGCLHGCAFRCSNSEAAAGRQRANKRLRSLDRDLQAAIADRYYKGGMPWRDEP